MPEHRRGGPTQQVPSRSRNPPGAWGLPGIYCVSRRRRCSASPSSSFLVSARQAPCARASYSVSTTCSSGQREDTARPSGVIAVAPEELESGRLLDHAADRRLLPIADLDRQQPVVNEVRRGIAYDARDRLGPLGASEQGLGGLPVADLGGERGALGLRHVGRVADDGVERG